MAPKRRKIPETSRSNTDPEPARVRPQLARIPPELFDEILSYFRTLPLNFHSDTHPAAISINRYRERTDALTALSQTCRALRAIALPLLWTRLDACWVPEHAIGTYYKYVMQELKRKTEGVRKSKDIAPYVQILTFMVTKSALNSVLPSLTALLKVPDLSNLRAIQVLSCNSAGALTKALSGLSLSSVRTVIVPNNAHGVLRSCPNATEVRCVGGTGKELVGALKLCKCEALEGYIDWTAPNLMDRLVKNAPALRKIEIRRPVNNGLGILSQNTAPAEWALILPKLSKLANLTEIQLTFPGSEELASDKASIAAARKALVESPVKAEKKLRVRRVIAPHYTNSLEEDAVHSTSMEVLS